MSLLSDTETLQYRREEASIATWQAILTLVLFFLSNLAVIFPFRVTVPTFFVKTTYSALVTLRVISTNHAPLKPRHLHLNFITVPLISVLLLLTTGVFSGRTVRDGIVGTDGIQPLIIMALFLSLAYISISLDATGLFRFLAFWVATKGGSSGRVLFSYLYLFFLICGVVVGNDPVILSGTAFLAYFTRVAGITPPTAWIFSQFAAANMASVVLVSSNPTNLVLAGAFRLSFLSYAAHVVLPFLAAAIAVFPVLRWLFRAPGLIPARIDVGLSPAEVRATLVDKRGAVFGSALLLATLAVLVGVSTIGVPVWEVTVPPAVLMLLRDLHYDWTTHRARQASQPAPDEGAATAGVVILPATCPIPDEPAVSVHELQDLESRTPSTAPPSPPSPATIIAALSPSLKLPRTPANLESALASLSSRATTTFPTAAHVAARLPVPLVPFAFLMFVLVQGLAAQGWVALFARGWGAWVRATGALGAVGGMGFLACALCNICGTNIGATILLARVLQLWAASPSAAALPALSFARAHDGAVYALALGSNFGAFTLAFSASLAGLLWRAILAQKGVRVRARQFLALNLPVSAAAMIAASAVLAGQVYVEHRG